MSHVLAGPPGDCCRQTVQHVGEKRGTIETVAGVETYVSRPKDGSNKRIILFFADVYGPIYINSQLIMDYWADNGYLVVGLDYFEDDSMTKHPDRQAPGFDYQDWLKRKQARAPELVGPWIEAIRKDYGSSDSKYVCVAEHGFKKDDRVLLRRTIRLRVPYEGLDTRGCVRTPGIPERGPHPERQEAAAFVMRRIRPHLPARGAAEGRGHARREQGDVLLPGLRLRAARLRSPRRSEHSCAEMGAGGECAVDPELVQPLLRLGGPEGEGIGG